MTIRFDAIVIGAGQAGPSLATRLAKSGKKTLIVERHLLGGTCVNVGCIPTKTLIASARAAHIARHAADYGIVIDGRVRVDMKRVKARKDAVVKQSLEGVTKWLNETSGLSIVFGNAKFVGPKSISVSGEIYEADQIFINVGCRAMIPEIPGLEESPFLTNSSMMDVDFLPDHLMIVGASYIGLEFAQMYRRFGSEVTVFEVGSRIVSREDEKTSLAIQAMLEAEGIKFKLNAKKLQVEKNSKQIVLSVEAVDKREKLIGSHLLIAVGRVPNTDDLGLEQAGIKTDARGYIMVNEELSTNIEGVWALGDVNGRGAFTHTAYNDYEIVASNLLDKARRRVSDRIPAYALYTDPPLARIGLSETEARKSGARLLVGEINMSRVGRARERGETTGSMSVIVDAESKQILGASLFGIEADEVIHCLLDVMYAKAPYTTIQNAVHIHPTVSELIPTLLASLKPLL